jgi:DNA-binding MarR family transcriptional regulator
MQQDGGPKDSVVREWEAQFERLGWFLARVGPDEVCCGGLTPRQCAVLRILSMGKGERLSDLAEAVGISPSAMTRALDRMEKQGLLRRVHGSMDDGRAATVEITERGSDVCSQLEQLTKQSTTTVIAAIPVGSRPKVLHALQILNSAFENAGCCGLDPASTLDKHKRR